MKLRVLVKIVRGHRFIRGAKRLVAAIIITVLAFLHVLTAMAWLGGGILFVSSIAPGLRSLSPAASLEFLAKVGPRATRFFLGSATATIVFGLALLGVVPGLMGTSLMGGVAIGLIAYLTAIMTMLSFRKADDIAKRLLAEGKAGPPPPELAAALKRGGMFVGITVLLLVVALMFMVATGFPF
jgi:hypothetical protein